MITLKTARRTSWNKGLTKESSPLLADIARKISKTASDGRMKGEGNPMFGRVHPNKGKTYEEIVGEQKARELRDMRRTEALSQVENGTCFGGKSMLGRHHTEKSNHANALAHKGRMLSSEHTAKISEGSKRAWSDPVQARRLAKALSAGNNKLGMNKAEAKLSYILRRLFPGEFRYNGEGQVLRIYRLAPDFVNINGRKQAIEVFSDFYKIKGYGSVEAYQRDRAARLGQAGYAVLFVRYEELRHPVTLKQKLSAFVRGEARV